MIPGLYFFELFLRAKQKAWIYLLKQYLRAQVKG